MVGGGSARLPPRKGDYGREEAARPAGVQAGSPNPRRRQADPGGPAFGLSGVRTVEEEVAVQPHHEHGTVRADSFYGVRDPHVREGGVAAPSGLPCTDRRCTGHTADGGRCTARTAKGTRYCIGHLRQRGEQ